GAAADVACAFNREQRRVQDRVYGAVDRALSLQAAADGRRMRTARSSPAREGWHGQNHCGPGLRHSNIGTWQQRPTNRHASRMRAKLPADVAVNTYHAAFGLDEKIGSIAVTLAQYSLIVIDEVSHLQLEHFEHVCRLWNQADNVPAVLLAGDEMQMGGFGDRRAWHSPMWERMVYCIKLHQVYRCKDPEFNQVFMELRADGGGRSQAPQGPPGHRHSDVHPARCAYHERAGRTLYPSGSPLVVLPADVDSNPDNYRDGQLLENVSALAPLRLPIYKGMQLVSHATFAKTSTTSMGWWFLSTQARKAWRFSPQPAFG
ncbi:pif1, partial [Symbiodinium pilosum]